MYTIEDITDIEQYKDEIVYKLKNKVKSIGRPILCTIAGGMPTTAIEDFDESYEVEGEIVNWSGRRINTLEDCLSAVDYGLALGGDELKEFLLLMSGEDE